MVSNPTLTLPLPDDGEEDLPCPPLSEDEVRALFDVLPRRTVMELRDACLLELLYGCDLRKGEALRLEVADLDLGRGVVAIRRSKHGQDHVVPLMGTARAAVGDYFAVRRALLRGPDQGALLLTQYGRRMAAQSLYRIFRPLNARRGPDAKRIHPHLLRHAIAVHLLRAGADVRHIQAFLGHASLDTTKVYLRLVPGRLKDDYERAMPEIAVSADGTGSHPL